MGRLQGHWIRPRISALDGRLVDDCSRPDHAHHDQRSGDFVPLTLCRVNGQMSQSNRVEFRLVQVVLSHIGDERITVGLVHWDGTTMRVAIGVPRLPRFDNRGSIGAIRSAVKADGRRALRAKGPGILADVFPVRGGPGSAYPYWTHIRIGESSLPEAHFEELRQHFQLKVLRLPRRKPKNSPVQKSPAVESHSI